MDPDNHQQDKEDSQLNKFANDGSFLAMFKKQMEGNKKPNNVSTTTVTREAKASRSEPAQEDPSASTASSSSTSAKKPSLPFVGKRRGGKVLPTGMVKKAKQDNNENKRKDVWSQYMNEVRKYKERSCEDDSKTRPLVK